MVTEFKNMIGRSMTQVEGAVGDERMVFHAYDGSEFVFWYNHDCCATCTINDIAGDLTDLVGSPLIHAELVSSDQNAGDKPSEYADSWTWSFYKFRTMKGDVTIRWLGESNGYYSETVTYSETLAK
jgi:hypothetical protein